MDFKELMMFTDDAAIAELRDKYDLHVNHPSPKGNGLATPL